MNTDLLLAIYLMAVGLCVAGVGTHLYQALARQQAMLRYDGASVFSMLGHLAMSFVCGPYIMLQMGWQRETQGSSLAVGLLLMSAFVAFGWAFVTGILFMSGYLAVLG